MQGHCGSESALDPGMQRTYSNNSSWLLSALALRVLHYNIVFHCMTAIEDNDTRDIDDWWPLTIIVSITPHACIKGKLIGHVVVIVVSAISRVQYTLKHS